MSGRVGDGAWEVWRTLAGRHVWVRSDGQIECATEDGSTVLLPHELERDLGRGLAERPCDERLTVLLLDLARAPTPLLRLAFLRAAARFRSAALLAVVPTLRDDPSGWVRAVARRLLAAAGSPPRAPLGSAVRGNESPRSAPRTVYSRMS